MIQQIYQLSKNLAIQPQNPPQHLETETNKRKTRTTKQPKLHGVDAATFSTVIAFLKVLPPANRSLLLPSLLLLLIPLLPLPESQNSTNYKQHMPRLNDASDLPSRSDFEAIGFKLMRREASRAGKKTRMRRFISWFGAEPVFLAITWRKLHKSGWLEYAGRKPNPEHLLWACMWMRCYQTEDIAAGIAGVDEKTFREWVWFYVEGIARLDTAVIQWANRLIGYTGQRSLVTVDGVDFSIPEPTPWSSIWWSHKFNGPGLRYELAICIATGWIVGYNGPFECGSWPDLRIFRSRLKKMLGKHERVVADRGYRGDPRVVIPDTARDEVHEEEMNVARARHETVNGRLKAWKSMSTRFRHPKEKHHMVFRAVAVIEQIKIMNGRPPFQCDVVVDPIVQWE